jgi:hypothetical protein
MSQTRFGEHACQKALAVLDPYIDNELLTESSLELMEHFRRCEACAREAHQRRNARMRLQRAVRGVSPPTGLEERVRDRLRQTKQPPPGKLYLMAIAASLAISFGTWAAYQRGSLRLTMASQESYVAAISGQGASILRIGLGDHLHCAIIRQRANRSKAGLDTLPAEFKGLAPIVQRHVPAELPLVLAHECWYQGRKFVHLTFRNDRHLLSLVIARKQTGESLSLANLLPETAESGIPMYTASARDFQVASFESREFLVYTVSDLTRPKNLDVLVSLAPTLQTFLNRVGA